jgi:hypothetical protein
MVDHKFCSNHIGIFKSRLHIFSLGVRNLTIRNELQIFNMNDKIKDNKNEWHEHIPRMDP